MLANEKTDPWDELLELLASVFELSTVEDDSAVVTELFPLAAHVGLLQFGILEELIELEILLDGLTLDEMPETEDALEVEILVAEELRSVA